MQQAEPALSGKFACEEEQRNLAAGNVGCFKNWVFTEAEHETSIQVSFTSLESAAVALKGFEK